MKETLKLALDEIKRVKEICLREVGIGLCNEVVIAKLEEALAQPEQEPVGFAVMQKPWVGLTDLENAKFVKTMERGNFLVAIYDIEKRLKEKNNG